MCKEGNQRADTIESAAYVFVAFPNALWAFPREGSLLSEHQE